MKAGLPTYFRRGWLRLGRCLRLLLRRGRRRRRAAAGIVGNNELEAKLQFTGCLFIVSSRLMSLALLDVKHLLDCRLVVWNEFGQVQEDLAQEFLGWSVASA